jgi:two-component sensor histidine kinase
MKKLLLTGVFMLIQLGVYSQDITKNLTPVQAISLIKLSHKTPSGAAKAEILLRLALFNILKSGTETKDIDSASHYIEQAADLVSRVKNPGVEGYLYYAKANLNREKGETESAKKLAEIAVSKLRNSSNYYYLALAYEELVQYHPVVSGEEVRARLELTKKAVTAAQQSNRTELIAFLLKNEAECYLMLSRYDEAIESIQQSLNNYKTIKYQKLQGVYTLFGTINYAVGSYHKTLDYMFKALRAAENTNDSTMQLCQIYNIIGLTYDQLDEPKNSIPYLNQALNIAIRYQDINNALSVMTSLVSGYVLEKQYQQAIRVVDQVSEIKLKPGDPGDEITVPMSYMHIYLRKKDIEKATVYVNKLQQILKQHKSIDGSKENNIYQEFIRYYLIKRDISSARLYFLKNDSLIGITNQAQMFKYQYWSGFRIDSLAGDFKGAARYLYKYIKLSDSLFSEKKSRQIKQIQTEYQTDKKEAQIKIKDQAILLLQQKELIQQRGLENAQLMKNITFGGIFLLTAILALLFRQYRLKQKGNSIVARNNVLITQKNQQLQNLLKEKEWLLKEVHHRVKNNLHTVICLLESQALYLENDALKAIENSQHRIYAMSLIHQKLYQSEDIKTIDMAVYLPEFIQYLNESFDLKHQIRFKLEIEQIPLGVSQAIPLALIVNEAITNAIKYAFPEQKLGIISLSLVRTGDFITLIISDNGIGIDLSIAEMPQESLGLKLIRGLSGDIQASIKIENSKGTRITIQFNIDPLVNLSKSFETLTEVQVG